MPYPVVSTDTYIEINVGGTKRRLNYADVPGNVWSAKRLERAKTMLQGFLDTRIPLVDLPDDEPTKTVDPRAEWGGHFFWEGGDLVGRPDTITDVQWDGERLVISQTLTKGLPTQRGYLPNRIR